MFDRRARIPAAPDTGAWHVLSLVSRRVLISAVWSRLDANYQLTFVRQGQPVSQDTLPASDWLPGHSPALWLAEVTGLGTPWNLSSPAWPLSVTVQVSGVGSLSCCHERDTWQCHDQCPGHLSHVSRALSSGPHDNGHSRRVNVSDVSRPDNFLTTGRRGSERCHDRSHATLVTLVTSCHEDSGCVT